MTPPPSTPIVGRTLLTGEWPEKLPETPLAQTPMDPLRTDVVVVEAGAQVVAGAVVINQPFVDGLWVLPAFQGHPGVDRALVTAIVQELVRQRVLEVLALSQTPETDALYAHAGGKQLPGTLWVIPVGGGT